MSRSAHPLTSAGRDAGLRRLRALNRVLVAVAVAGMGLLTEVAAQAFPGHKRVVRPPVAAQPTSRARPAVAAHRRHPGRRHHPHVTHRALKPPAQAPTTSASSTQQPTAPAPQTTVAPPPPAPAPVVSGGS